MVICLERGADLHMAQLMPLPLTVSCFSKIQIGFPFWYRPPYSPGKRAVKQVCYASSFSLLSVESMILLCHMLKGNLSDACAQQCVQRPNLDKWTFHVSGSK